MPRAHFHAFFLILIAGSLAVGESAAQRGPGNRSRAAGVRVEPDRLTLEIGETAVLTATPVDDQGNPVDAPTLFLSRSRRNLTVSNTGRVDAYGAGQFTLIVRVAAGGGPGGGGPDPRLSVEVPVTVLDPPLERVEVHGISDRLYTGAVVSVDVDVYDRLGTRRRDASVVFQSADPDVMSVDRFGLVVPLEPGATTLRVLARGGRDAAPLTVDVGIRVERNPVARLVIEPEAVDVRTGDVVRFEAIAVDADGSGVAGIPVVFSIQTYADAGNPAAPAGAQIAPDGRFVAELPGRYRVMGTGGGMSASATIEVSSRDVSRGIEVLGRAPVRDRHTSDLWVWESSDGRDYAMTGTWGSDGSAYVWDVTNPENIQRVSSVQVDARTVNDVKVSEDGRLGVISREGASNRQNGIVLLDMSVPRNVTEISQFSDELTGGVHNTFIYRDHVYALSNGRRYDVINVAEPRLPFRVGRFELDTQGHSIHDVWVEDGIAYSSNWEDGVVLVDVGNGVAGGAPDNPVQFARYADPMGRTHAAFPFRSESTGKFYVITGDEFFPAGINPEGPTVAGGYMHVVDFTDLENPEEVARFEVPEAGSHNLWVEHDVLYAAYYNGGVRVVDLSGELMGDLYRQGREIAAFVPKDGEGYVKNEAMVWGVQPHKNAIYVSDWNSGLWVIRLRDEASE